MRKYFWILLLTLFIFNFGFRIYQNWGRYTENLSGEYWKERYLKSQWVVPNSQEGIGDDGLYAYHGWELVNGGDPSHVNPEVPPAGKYLIGIFVVFFHNNNLFGLAAGVGFLLALFLLSKQLFRDRLMAFLPVVLISFEPLFYTQLQASFLDTLHVTMLLLTFYFFLKKKYLLTMISAGLFASVKFSPLIFFVIAALLLFQFIVRRNELLKLVQYLPIPLVVLLATYFRYFFIGHTLLDYLKLQKFIFMFYMTGAKSPVIAMVVPMIFLNKWYTWWAGVQKVTEWSILWPLSFVGGIISCRYLQKDSPFLLLVIWCSLYFLFLLVTPVWPRYLLLFLPFLYNLSIWALLRNTTVRSWLHLES